MDTTQRIRRIAAFALVFGASALSGCAPSADDAIVIDSLHSEYLLDRDEDGTAVLDVTETLVVRFPAADVNRGIRRELPTRLEDQDTPVQLLSVTDAAGSPVAYTAEPNFWGPQLDVAIAEDDFVHGEREYALHDTVRNVLETREYGSRLLWHVNGSHWAQPFGHVTARVTLGDGIRPHDGWQLGCWLRKDERWLDEECGVDEADDVITFDSAGATHPQAALPSGVSLAMFIPFREETFTVDRATGWQPWNTHSLFLTIGVVLVAMAFPIGLTWLVGAGSGADGDGWGGGGDGGGDGGGGGA